MSKCEVCNEDEAIKSWQPFASQPSSVLQICYTCSSSIETGDFPFSFTYKGFRYRYHHGNVTELAMDFWDGGTTDFHGDSATMIMKSTPDESELVALVMQAEYVPFFTAAPQLVNACKELLNVFPQYGSLPRDQGLAVAGIKIILEEIERKRYTEEGHV